MNSQEAKNRIEKLSNELHEHNYKYYLLDEPIITDREFDVLLEELQELEREFPDFALDNSPTKRVGGTITKNFKTVKHLRPMLSLGNSYSKNDLEEFEIRIKKLIDEPFNYTAELKYDGVAIGLRYSKGKLVQAITRGDGIQGDEVTTNVKTIQTIPLQLTGDYPEEFEIRGEIFMSKKSFQTLNAQKAAAGEALMANPRNTASGTLKMQDSKIVAQRNLDCFLYHVIGDDLPFDNHYENLKAAQSWGFNVPTEKNKYIKHCKGLQEVFEFIDYWGEEKERLGFEVDGVVVKVNDYGQQEKLGYTAKSPRWAIAFKFETERVTTTLLEVTYQVGRTGAITPVAVLAPVQLLGTTVKRASLHNEDFIEGFDLHEEDEVFIEKGGEIIPKVVGVKTSARRGNALKIEHLKACPECKSELERKEGEANYYCNNDAGCPPQITGKIQHFVSRKAMNIDGLGEETVEQLFEAGLISNIADLYDLKGADLLPLDRMAEKSINNLILGLQASKKVPFPNVLFALGIRFVGQTVAKKLADAFLNITALRSASVEELEKVNEIGGVIAQSVVDYFQNETNCLIVDRLIATGLQFEIEATPLAEVQSSLFAGKTFVVSGVFTLFSRDELKKIIEENGGKNVSAISKSTSFVVAGDKMGPSKKIKAEKFGVSVVSEDEFMLMLKEEN